MPRTDAVLVMLDIATSKLGEGGVVGFCPSVLEVAFDDQCFWSEVHCR